MDRCGTPPTQRSRTFLAVLCSELTSHLLNLFGSWCDSFRYATQWRRGGAAHRRPEHYPPPASRQRPGEAQKRRVVTIVDLFPFMWRFFTVTSWLKACGGVECSHSDHLRHHVPTTATTDTQRLAGLDCRLQRDEALRRLFFVTSSFTWGRAGKTESLPLLSYEPIPIFSGGRAAPGFTLAETLAMGRLLLPSDSPCRRTAGASQLRDVYG